ncbi:MAG: hypothetical protein JWO12_549, partial [Frankiales bacterium]|nr:hypothetical protein [Frankiales bacterium]
MSETPLYDATLADQLRRARRSGEIARARWTLAERAAGERAAEAERQARMRVAQVERQAAARVA